MELCPGIYSKSPCMFGPKKSANLVRPYIVLM